MKKLVSLRNKKGFTLVELIIVIAIIAVLAAVVAPQYLKYVDKSKLSTDKSNLAAVETAINLLIADGSITATTTSKDVVVYAKGGALTGDNAKDVCELVGGTVTTSGASSTYATKALTSSTATANDSYTFSVVADANGIVKVSCSTDFHTWNE